MTRKIKFNENEAEHLGWLERGNYLAALECVERYYRHSGLSIRDFDANLYGCFCVMYLLDPNGIDDNSRFLPNSWRDLSAAVDFLRRTGESNLAFLLDEVDTHASILRRPEFVDQIGFEDFIGLRIRGIISPDMETALSTFRNALGPGLDVTPWETPLGIHLKRYARDEWSFECIGASEASAWLSSEVGNWSPEKQREVHTRLMR